MVDQIKPDLFVHKNFLCEAKNLINFSDYINLKEIKDLDYTFPNFKFVTDTTVYSTDDQIELEPFFKFYSQPGISDEAHHTSYNLIRSTKPKSINLLTPRYVIWTLHDPLPISATVVDRIKDDFDDNLFSAIKRAKKWSKNYMNMEEISVIVFDLDDTLINEDNKFFKGVKEVLEIAKNKYDKLVLWSHGSSAHVENNELLLNKLKPMFDLVLSNQTHKSPKNLLHLYTKSVFENCYFGKAVLVDDCLYNFCHEYTKIIVPHVKKNVLKILDVL